MKEMEFMTINEILRSPTWVCQWRCPYMGEMNRSRKQDLPLEIESPDDLPQHLICHCCKMDLGSIPLIHLVIHPTCPAAIPQRKKFTIHFWPEER
jgi:hypothetical protein